MKPFIKKVENTWLNSLSQSTAHCKSTATYRG